MSQGPTGTGWSVDMLDRWTPENPYTDVPRLTTSPQKFMDKLFKPVLS